MYDCMIEGIHPAEFATSFVHFKHPTWLDRTELVALDLFHCRVFHNCLVAQLAQKELGRSSEQTHFTQGSRG
jgi:hypothetical protein